MYGPNKPAAPLKQGFPVLVVDDSPVQRKLLEFTLPADLYTLLPAKSGREAMELFAKHQPALVITDWMMPDLTGVELCRRIRSEFPSSFTYIILLTSISEKDKVVEGLQAGADDYLTKPFHPAELVARAGVGRRIIELHREIEAKNRLLEKLALTEPLTGLPNRRAIEEWANRQLQGAARCGFEFWVVMADLDHFKAVNDTYGHEAGNTVLMKFAEILKANTRKCDIAGRIGGEEFLIILTHADRNGVQIAIERIREQWKAQRFPSVSRDLVVTASFGVAAYSSRQGQEFERLAAQADVALYSAKQLGRNRTEFATTEVYEAKEI